MRVLLTGASGFIGSHLLPVLESEGHQVSRLSGSKLSQSASTLAASLNDLDSVIHLAGESIMGRWTPRKKARILESRTSGTGILATALAGAANRPQSFIVASAVGYYGPHGDEVLKEDSPPGNDFLAEVGQQWEAAAEPARQAGIRTVHLRIGVVLSPDGGALKQMLTPFRLGLGGRIGSGKQWMSWIALDDVIGAILFALENSALAGPVNLVAPNPVTNAEFTRALGLALHRPTMFPMPAPVVKLLFGEMGESLLLSGQRVVPAKLQASGYKFHHTEIGETLSSMLD
jgi:uncharacterized protein (TIGR01777 family)